MNEDKYEMDPVSSVIGGICALIIGLIGVISNGLIMWVVLKRSKIRKHLTSPLLFIMCVSNFLFSSIALPIRASTLFARKWTLGDSLCKIVPLFYWPNVFVSMLSCAFISMNRAIALRNYKLAGTLFSWKKTIFIYNLMWQFSVGCMLLPLYKVWGQLGYTEHNFFCEMKETETGNPMKGLLAIAVGILFSVVSISCISIQVWLHSAKKKKKFLYACSGEKVSAKKMKAENQITNATILTVVSFFALYIPNFVIEVVDAKWKYPGIHVACYIICWCWLFVNPAIYYFASAHIRSAFRFTFGLRKTAEDTTYVSASTTNKSMIRHVSLASLQVNGTLERHGRKISKSASSKDLTSNSMLSVEGISKWPSAADVISKASKV